MEVKSFGLQVSEFDDSLKALLTSHGAQVMESQVMMVLLEHPTLFLALSE